MAITARYLFFFGLSFFPMLQYMRTGRLESLFLAQHLIGSPSPFRVQRPVDSIRHDFAQI